MIFNKITSDGTLKGTKVLNELGLPAHPLIRRVIISIGPEPIPRVEVHYIDTGADGDPRVEDGNIKVAVVERALDTLNLTVKT